MRLGYSFYLYSQRNATSIADYGSNALGIRFNVESAGNVLYGFSNLFEPVGTTKGNIHCSI